MIKRLRIGCLAVLLLAAGASRASAVYSEAESLFVVWQTTMIAVDVAQVYADTAEYGSQVANGRLTEAQIEVSVHYAGHPNCDPLSCVQMELLLEELSWWQQYSEQKYHDYQSALYVLHSAEATEQQAWWDLFFHFDICAQCD